MSKRAGQIMTTPGIQAGTRLRQGTPGEALRAAADFIESSGQRSGLIISCAAGEVRIRVAEPYFDAAARQAVVTRLAGLIGGPVRQEDDRGIPAADLRADGTIGGLHTVIATGLSVRRTRRPTGNGQPLAEAPGGKVAAVPGELPDGWRWITELDPEPGRALPEKQRSAAPALPAPEAPELLAARDCPPLTGAALQAAARQEQAATAQPARHGSAARPPLAQPSR
jgi:hypothetical protein